MNRRDWIALGIFLSLLIANWQSWTVKIDTSFLAPLANYPIYERGETIYTLQYAYDILDRELFTYADLTITYRFAAFAFLLYLVKGIPLEGFLKPVVVLTGLGVITGVSILVLGEMASKFGFIGFGLGVIILLILVWKLPIKKKAPEVYTG